MEFVFALSHYPTPFAPMPDRYMEYTSHTRVGHIHNPSHWLVATDGSVARQKDPDGPSVRRMTAGVVLVRHVSATWADCPHTDSLHAPTGYSSPPAAPSPAYLSAPNSPPRMRPRVSTIM